MGGDTMFQVYKDNGFEWDCSWATRNFVNPGMWPYTLDYRSVQVFCDLRLNSSSDVIIDF